MIKFISAVAIAIAMLATPMAVGSVLAQDAANPRDLVQEEANRKLVVDFYNQFFNQHDTTAAVVADGYIQHNPDVPDGKAALVGFFTGFFKDNPQSKAEVVRSATDGDLVFLHIHATNGADDRGQSIVDIFRVSNGQIVEHWDVIQNVPEPSANTNTMF
jgi:predicted SnoaL-like aldol condensation-catalyzing enzyme